MKKLYLSSEIHYAAKNIMEDIKQYKNSFITAFIITCTELMDDPEWVNENRQGMKEAGFEVFDYTLTGKTSDGIAKDLKKADIIHVNGGSCVRIVKEAKKSGFDKWIKRALDKGVIYTGSSGGSIATAPDVSSIYREKREYPMGLNLAPFMIIPHWGRPDRHDLHLKERLPKIIEEKHKLVLLNDTQYIKVEGEQFEFVDIRDESL
jgi:peptidase E